MEFVIESESITFRSEGVFSRSGGGGLDGNQAKCNLTILVRPRMIPFAADGIRPPPLRCRNVVGSVLWGPEFCPI
jgi:hypothetical protein